MGARENADQTGHTPREPVQLHEYWVINNPVLQEFIQMVDRTRQAFEEALTSTLGSELTTQMGLAAQVDMCRNLNYWHDEQVNFWYECLAVRRAILSKGERSESAERLARRTQALEEDCRDVEAHV